MRAQGSDDSITLLLDYKRAAEALSHTEQALRDLVARGRGPIVTKIGRRRFFAVADLHEFVARHRSPPTPPVDSDPFARHLRRRRKKG
jgi:hypothetical protein